MRLILRHETSDFGRGPKLAVLKSFVLRTPLYTYKVLCCSQGLHIRVIFINIYRIRNQTTISQNQNINITTGFITKVFKYWNAVKPRQIKFPKF